MKVNSVRSRLGVLADFVLTGFADIDVYHLLELLALIYHSYTRLRATLRGMQDDDVKELDEMLTQTGLLVEFGSLLQSFLDSVMDEPTAHLPYADLLAPDYLRAHG